MFTATHRRATVSVGTVREAAEGETPSVEVTDGQVLNFVLPHGIKGDTGAAGPQGPKGDAGDVADNFHPIADTGVEALCDEVLSNSGTYTKPDTSNYFLDDVTGFKPMLQKLKDFFAPQSRTINGKTLAANITLTPSDIGAVGITVKTATLASGSWSSKKQTVTVAGVAQDNHILVTPDPTSYLNYHKWKVRATAQFSNAVQFTTDGTPSADLTVQVLILNDVGT